MDYFDVNVYETVEYLGTVVFSFVLGVVTTVVCFVFLFWKYINFSASVLKQPSPGFKQVVISDAMKKNLNFKSSKFGDSVESCRFLNVLLSFIFNEWRDTEEMHNWILKKINVELEELMEEKAARKILRSLKIRDIDLGSSVPVLKGIKVKEPCFFTNDRIPANVIIDVEVLYEGGFFLAVDADLMFETSASLAICIKHLSGNLRLQLSRYPCTHWAASFLEKPAITVSVDTSFQSRPLPQLGSVIVNQFYKSIKKKHTFPNYKLRYTPFYAFHSEKNTPSVPFVAGAQPVVGRINVTIVSCTRLLLPQYDKGKQGVHRVSRVVFATISLDAETCEGREAIKNEEPVEKLSFAAASAGLLLTTPNKLKQAFFDDSEDKSVEQDSGIANDEPTRINKPEIKQSTTKNEKLPEKTRNLALSVPVNPVNEPSYMMITRSFSALLYEKPNTESDVEKSTIVQVGSINMNNSSKGKPNISEGDIILSINGSEVKSLGQAIAIINDIRLKKKSFQFKVQRSRNYQPPVKLANLKKEPSSSPTTNSLPGPSKPTPPTLVESEASDTESDFSDLDYMDDHLEPPLFDDTRQIPFLGNSLNQSRNRYTKTGNYKGILIKKKSGKKSNSNMSIFDKDESLDFAKITPQSTNEILKTTLSHCDQPELQWNAETYSLKLKEDQAYLNIRFWYQEIPLSPGNKKEVRMLLGNIGIRLCHLSAQCNMLTSRKLTQKYKISSPLNSSKDESIRWNLNESFTQRLNFRRDYCYGDATIVTQLKD